MNKELLLKIYNDILVDLFINSTGSYNDYLVGLWVTKRIKEIKGDI